MKKTLDRRVQLTSLLKMANMETYVAHARYPKENFFLIDFMPDLEPETEAIATESLFVVDSSPRIGRVELGRIKALVKALISRLPKGHKVNVIFGDVDTQACFAKSLVPKTDSQLDQCLNSISAGGGTDLGKMLESSLKVRSPNTGSESFCLAMRNHLWASWMLIC